MFANIFVWVAGRVTFAAFIGATISSAAVSKNYAIDLTPERSQVSQFNRGVEMIDSPKERSTVRLVEFAGAEENEAIFKAIVLNKSNESFLFGPSEIIIKQIEGQIIQIETYEEKLASQRKRQKRQQFFTGLGALGRSLSASEAGEVSGSGEYRNTTTGQIGNNYVRAETSGTFSYKQDDPAARAAAEQNAQAINLQEKAKLDARWSERLAGLETILRANTVQPEGVYGGVVSFAVPESVRKAKGPTPIVIEVLVAGERHIFSGQISEQK